MSSTTYMLEKDTPPHTWSGTYDPLLRFGGDEFPLINELRDLLTGKFKIVLKLSKIQNNLYINGKCCLVRKNKFQPITVYPNCKILEGTDLGVGGSNAYPCLSFKEGYCIVEVITDGFPHFQLQQYKMKIEILKFEKL